MLVRKHDVGRVLRSLPNNRNQREQIKNQKAREQL